MATGELAQEEQAVQVHVDHLAKAVDGFLLGGYRRSDSRIVHQQVEVTVDPDGLSDETLAVGIVRHIARDRNHSIA